MLTWLRNWRDRREAARRAKYLARMAHEFNVHNTPTTSFLQEHGRWMCPDCNRVHCCIGWTPITGAQYPACCRHDHGPRVFV